MELSYQGNVIPSPLGRGIQLFLLDLSLDGAYSPSEVVFASFRMTCANFQDDEGGINYAVRCCLEASFMAYMFASAMR